MQTIIIVIKLTTFLRNIRCSITGLVQISSVAHIVHSKYSFQKIKFGLRLENKITIEVSRRKKRVPRSIYLLITPKNLKTIRIIIAS